MNWPVSVATDGQHVVVADTYNGRVLIWNDFSTQNGAAAAVVIVGSQSGEGGGVTLSKSRFGWPWGVWTNGEKLGIPRTITSDGRSLIVGDHNARVEGQHETRNFFWRTFPTTDDQLFDFFMSDPVDWRYAWLQGDFTEDGKLILLERSPLGYRLPPRLPAVGQRPLGDTLALAGGRTVYI